MKHIGTCSVHLQRKEFLIQANFEIPSRGILGIFGDSGSGKTTLLRCLAGLENNTQGHIKINGQTWLDETKNLPSQLRNIGYIFQETRLFPHMTVLANLEYGEKRGHRENRFTENNALLDRSNLFELLSISHLLNRKPHQLSGGEKQRVAIGRALLKNPQLLLMDEPLASLDEKHKHEILPFLDCLHEQLNIPILYVSHSLEEVSRLCDHILVMQQGRIQFSGTLHDALVSPQSPLAHANNATAVLEGIVNKQEKNFHLSTVQTANGNQIHILGLIPIGHHVRVGIKASDVSLCKTAATDSSILNILEGSISAIIEEHDAHILLQIDCHNDILLARISRKSFQQLGLGINQATYVQIKTASIQRNTVIANMKQSSTDS
jgi:molybdate transport system ATP-binding protein